METRLNGSLLHVKHIRRKNKTDTRMEKEKTTAEYGKFHIFNSYPNNNNPAQQEDNHLVPDIPENKESHPTSSNQCLAPDDVKNSRFEIHNLGSGEAKRKGMACSRGVKIFHTGLGLVRNNLSHKQKSHKKIILLQARVNNDSKIEPRELV